MQNFTAEKWAAKIALFIDNFGFLSGFFWHWTIALPSPTSHIAMLHSKIILSDPNRRVKVVLHRLFLILKPMQNLGYLLSLLDCFLIDSTTLPPCLYPNLGWAYCYVLIIHNDCEMSLELEIFNPSSLFGIHGLLMKDSKLQSAMPPQSHKLPFSPQLIERTKKRGEKGLNVVIKRGETMTKGALRGQVGQKMGRKGEEMMTKGSECGTCLDSWSNVFLKERWCCSY